MAKITLFLVFILSLQAFATATAQRITLKVEGATLNEVMIEVYRQSGYSFLSDRQLLRKSKPVHLDLKDVEVEDALASIFADQPFGYELSEKMITAKDLPHPAGSHFIGREHSSPLVVQALQEVGGRVTDSLGNPLQGATIRVLMPDERTVILRNGVPIQAASDMNGRFQLQNVPEGAVLEISYMGYIRQIISVRADLGTIILKEATTSMSEIVVTGLYERPRETYTGASRSFDKEELAKVSGSNVLTALRSLDPSFQIMENINLGSDPNALPEIVLRGGNSLPDIGQEGAVNPFNYTSNPNTPLFILDGFEVSLSRINDLDMNRIARVDILKDAGATAIYGSRAANGVIVIETVRPQPGELRFSYNANMVVEAPDLTGYDLLNATEKLEIEARTGVYDFSWNFRQDELDIIRNARQAEILRGVNTNWLAKPLRSGVGHRHNIYVEGGDNSTLYGVGLTYNQRSGVMKASDRENTTGNTFLSYRINNFLFRNDLTLGFNKANNSPYGSFTQYTRLNPYWSPYDENGLPKIYLEEIYHPQTGQRMTHFDAFDNLDGRGQGRPVNPLYNASLNVVDQTSYWNLQNNFFVQWQARNWLRATGRFSYQRQSDESDRFLPAQHTSFVAVPTFEKGSYTKGYGKQSALEGLLSLDINKTFGKNLFFSTVSMNMSERRFNTETFSVQGFPNSKLDQLVLGNRFPDGSKPTGTESLSRLFGVLANASYSYDNRYMLDFSYRLDGSSQFGSANRFAPFWSLGGGWNLHNESFVKSLGVIDRLKLRYSYGYTGSQNFDSYLGITTSQYHTSREYRGIIPPYLLGYGNTNLAWQKTRKSNFGADITIMQRLDINANYFVERTQGSIASVTTAPSSGFGFYYDNIGDVLSKGFEINSRFNIIATPVGRNNWSLFANLFSVSNKIEQISNTLDALNQRADNTLSTTPIIRFAEGQSTTAIWAVRSLGIDPATGDEVFLTRDGQVTSNYSPLNQVIVGDTRADLEGTFGTNFELNGIGVNAYLRFSIGGQAYNQTLINRVENVDVSKYNVDRRVYEDRWVRPGDVAFFKGIIDHAGYLISEQTNATSRFVQDNNFVNLESVSVYYRFSDQLNRRLGLQNTRLTLFSNDVFHFSSVKRERGLDYPFSRSFTFQLQTSF